MVPGGAESEDLGRLSFSVTCPLAWASPLPRLDAASSLQAWGCFSAGEADSTSRLGGALWGEEVRARGLSSHPCCPCPLPAFGQRQPFHADVLLSVQCVLHPAHVVGCSLPPSIFAAGEEGG